MKIAFGHFKHVRSLQWKIECYHHALKEVCHVCRFFVRWKGAICNHVFCSLRAFLKLEVRRSHGQISTWYQFKRHFADQSLTTFIQHMVKHPHGA